MVNADIQAQTKVPFILTVIFPFIFFIKNQLKSIYRYNMKECSDCKQILLFFFYWKKKKYIYMGITEQSKS